MCHPALLTPAQLLTHCRVRHTRRSGPGGQHRNKVHTAVVIEHLPTGLQGEASERRSQAENRHRALQRLRLKLALAERHPAPAELPQVWQKRVQADRLAVNPGHEDFPALLALALDTIWSHGFAMAAAAPALHVTTSQLVRFLKLEPAALAAVNRQRLARGQQQLR